MCSFQHRKEPQTAGAVEARIRSTEVSIPPELATLTAVDKLIGYLANSDVRYRMAAAKRLGEIRDPRTVQPLIDAITNEPPSKVVRGFPTLETVAIEALANIGTPDARKGILAILKSLLARGPRLREYQQVDSDARYYSQILAGVQALGAWADDADARTLLESLVDEPDRWRGKIGDSVQIAASTAILRRQMQQDGIAGKNEEIRYLLAHIEGKRVRGLEDRLAPGLLTAEAAKRGATFDLLLSHGTAAVPAIEAQLDGRYNSGNERDQALQGLLRSIHERATYDRTISERRAAMPNQSVASTTER
ncbi:MAG: HEAT repeat domain-containing protein [Armatimonadota bacterium]